MAALSLEERVAALETKLEHLEHQRNTQSSPDDRPWWEQIRGRFQNNPAYDEAMRLGREYRESLRPKDDEDV